MSLSTRYLGLPLAHPIVAGASPLTATLDGMKRLFPDGLAGNNFLDIGSGSVIAQLALIFLRSGWSNGKQIASRCSLESDSKSRFEAVSAALTTANIAAFAAMASAIIATTPMVNPGLARNARIEY